MSKAGSRKIKLKKGNIFVTHSPEETETLGAVWGALLPPGSVLAFQGNLGAGKTTLIKGIAKGCEAALEHEVSSPTFTYLNIYEGPKFLYHFDLYRLQGAQDFLEMGFDEFLTSQGICCIEWSERIQSLLPANTLWINIRSLSPTSREIHIL